MVLPNEITCEIKPDATHPLSTGGPIWYIPRSGGDGAVASGQRKDFFPPPVGKRLLGKDCNIVGKEVGNALCQITKDNSLSLAFFSAFCCPLAVLWTIQK